MSKTKSRLFLQGLIAAQVGVAEVTGGLSMATMSEQTWKVICSINLKLTELALAEAKRLDDA